MHIKNGLKLFSAHCDIAYFFKLMHELMTSLTNKTQNMDLNALLSEKIETIFLL